MRCVLALLGLVALLGLEPAIGAPPTTITANGFGTVVHPPSAGVYNITGGKTAGSNLFQSFSTFNLGTGDTADFNVSSSISNILARVTGGQSVIDGTFTSTVGAHGPFSNANLFLINPAGVIFGPNAAINLNGAFVVSSASYVKFNDGSIFYGDVNHPVDDQGLTSAPVSAFGFLNATPAPIIFEGTELSSGTGIHVLGGDVLLDNGAGFFASSGLLTIFSAASTGEVPFTLATAGAGYANAPFAQFGNITVQNGSNVQIAGSAGGKVVIRGGRLTVDDSAITSANTGAGAAADISLQADAIAIQDQAVVRSVVLAGGPGGAIQIQAGTLTIPGTGDPAQITGIDSATDTSGQGGDVRVVVTGGLSLSNGGVIGESTFGPGSGGNMTIQAGSIDLDNAGFSNTTYDVGSAGSLTVTATGALTITGFGFIDGTTFASGTAGDVMVRAGSMSIDGSATGPGNDPGVFAQAQSATGNAGSVTVIVASALSIATGGEIDSSTFGSGHGGNVDVVAGSLVLTGSDVAGYTTSISANSPTGASGNAGTVTVDVTGALQITSAGAISGSTFSPGLGGNVSVHAGTLTIDGSATPDAFTGIVSSAGAAGNAGSLAVNVDGAINLSGRGEIGSGTTPGSSGNSGDVTVNAGSLAIVGANGPGNPSGIDAQAIGTGTAGKLTVTVAGGLSIAGFGEIDTSTFSSGAAGDITVRAGAISLDGAGSPAGLSGILSTATGGSSGPAGSVNVGAGSVSLADGAVISSASFGAGPGGGVLITAGDVTLNGASSVSASATHADAGTVEIDATTLSLLGSSTINTSAGANGGNITLHVGQLVYLLDSQIVAEAIHNGGNILIDPQFVVLDNSLISANAALGQGGNITILTNDFLNNNSFITATGTTNGTITISAPDLNLSNSLVALPDVLVSEENRLRENCARSVNHEFSTFIVVGRGGTEAAPEELQADFGFGEGVEQ